ncbi:MAG TPA: ChaN family lipoprotein, partial [Rhodothermales bacterium]|nr:ChaN family lipoprotein [Rhodothermales bacterium]
ETIPSDSTEVDMTTTYRVYRADGSPATLDDVFDEMAEADAVFVGEQHDDPVGHYLEAELLEQAFMHYGQGEDARPVALSLEMFARDVQPILDEYLSGLITEDHFRSSSRPWGNYETDYRPMVEFAKAHNLPIIAANAPRRYVNRVSRLGPASLDSLSAWAKSWLPPLPYPPASPAYGEKWNALMAEMMAQHQPAPPDSVEADPLPADSLHATHRAPEAKEHAEAKENIEEEDKAPASLGMHGMGYILDAQAFWDAAMADAISQFLAQTPDALVLHMVGSFHVEEGLGTPAQLSAYKPGTRNLIIIMQAADDITQFEAEEHANLGDFVILTDASLPRSM